MKHIFIKGKDASRPTLLLLHGTGGNEHDLLPLATMIDGQASVLSVRGNILENGMPRFFRRLAEGVFDEQDLIFRTKELYEFLDEATEKYGIDRKNIIAIGYSNGANIAANLFFQYRDVLRAAILHHPMVPRRGIDLPDLTGIPIFITAGANDTICPPKETEELQAMMEGAGAEVDIHWHQQGHRLTQDEAEAAEKWYASRYSK
ncbi:MAG: alpha/beta hydrolase [Bacillus sp. (in: firmicutes)]